MKLAVIFPGIGYHSDKPLLYYSKKAAAEAGYDIIEIKYTNLPRVERNDRSTMIPAYEESLKQCENQLCETDFSKYNEVLFISKSLGTMVASAYTQNRGLTNVKHLCFTPVKETFDKLGCGSGLIFHGLSDPWCDSSIVYSEYKKIMDRFKLYTFEDSNHSLETGVVMKDIQIMQHIVRTVCKFLSE